MTEVDDHTGPIIETPHIAEGIEADDVNTTMIVAIGLIATALVLASVLGVTAMVDSFQAMQVQQKVNNTPYSDANEILRQQRIKLNENEVDPTNPNVYFIPIGEAKKLVVNELRTSRETDPN